MNNRIQKIANAIGCCDEDRCIKHEPSKCKDCLERAKCAIAAMINPTKEMIKAGNKASNDNAYVEPKAFRAMIKSLLK